MFALLFEGGSDMFLQSGRDVIEAPSLADLEAAVEAALAQLGHVIRVGRSPTDFVEAEHLGGGSFRLSYASGSTPREANQPVEPAEAAAVLALFLEGSEAWRSRHEWEGSPVREMARFGDRKAAVPVRAPVAALSLTSLFLVLLISLFVFWPYLPRTGYGLFDIRLPAAIDSTPARIILGFVVVVTLIVLALLAIKTWETRGTGRWPAAKGKITRSQEAFTQHRTSSQDMPQNYKVADIAYEYVVAGKRHTGRRISHAEIISQEEVPELLARYPVGAEVEVFHDPDEPSDAVLERGAPPGLAKGCLALVAITVGGTLLLMWMVTSGGEIVQRLLPNSMPPVLAITGLAGLAFTGAGIGILRTLVAARRWPQSMATIRKAEVIEFTTVQRRDSGSSNSRRRQVTRSWKPVVEYDYEVNGRSHLSRSIWLDREDAGTRKFAEGVVARYPVGSQHAAFYDPANPGRSALEIKGGAVIWLLFAVGLFCLFVAFVSTGLIPGWVFWQQPTG
jgi:hypothetical protein